MGYLHDFRAELERMLDGLEAAARERVISFVSAKVYESYKNGVAARSPEQGGRDTKAAPRSRSRRRELR